MDLNIRQITRANSLGGSGFVQIPSRSAPVDS